MSDAPNQDSRGQHAIAREVFTTLLEDQMARSDSLNATAGVLVGLGGVITTLAAIVPDLSERNLGRAGIGLAGLSVVIAVVGLLQRRPGREPVELDGLLGRILDTGDTTLTEDVLLYTDVAAAKRNDERLRAKALWILAASLSLAAGVAAIVVGIIVVSAS
jgi:hypothetical protein